LLQWPDLFGECLLECTFAQQASLQTLALQAAQCRWWDSREASDTTLPDVVPGFLLVHSKPKEHLIPLCAASSKLSLQTQAVAVSVACWVQQAKLCM